MSSFTLPSPPITFTVQRKTFIDIKTEKIKFQGSCSDGTFFVIWDRDRIPLSKEATKLIASLQPSDKVEVTGKWSTWINSKTAKHRLSFLLEGIEAKEPSEDDDDLGLPREEEFNYEETDDALMLKALTYQSDLAKLERRAEGRSDDVLKIIKRSKLSHPSDDDDGEQEGLASTPSQVQSRSTSSSKGASSSSSVVSQPSSSVGGMPSSSAGGMPSSLAGGVPTSSAGGLSSSKGKSTKGAGTHTRFGGGDDGRMDVS